MPRVVKDFTVAQKGIGRPDYFVPYRTEVEPTRQTTWGITFEPFDVPAGPYTATFYVVPANRYLVVGYAKFSASIDAIAYASWLVDGNVRFPLYMRGTSVAELPDTSGLVFEGGTILGLYGENPLDVAVSVCGSISGFLYDM